MQIRSLSLALVLVVAVTACGEKSRTRAGQTDFVTKSEGANGHKHETPPGDQPSLDQAEGHKDQALKDQNSGDTAPPPPENSGSEDTKVAQADAPATSKAETKSEPLIVKGEAKSSMTAYKIPRKLEERLKQTNPDLVPSRTEKFEVINQHLHISTAKSEMTFSGVLRIPGKQDEPLELRCKFDQSEPAWSCGAMLPVDPRVAAERRLQATANCLDTLECQRVAVELFVVIDGKTESQHFQNQKFRARKASSGDVEEDEDASFIDSQDQKPSKKTPAQPEKKQAEQPRIYQKPTPSQPEPTAPADSDNADDNTDDDGSEQAELNEKQIEQSMDNPNEALEITAPIPMPSPTQSQYSIPGIEKLRPVERGSVKPQAYGFHSAGHLKSPDQLPGQGSGFLCRQRKDRNFGTEQTIKILMLASASVAKNFKNRPPIVIANISKQTGGTLCGAPPKNGKKPKCHGSHQTGLDVDIAYPSTTNHSDMWSACGKDSRGRDMNCSRGMRLVREFDEERFWHFTKQLVCAKDGKPVIAMFVANEIKAHMCEWARQNAGKELSNPSSCGFRALQAMKYWPGHHNHVHVRFSCPGNRDCRDATVSLAKGTGC